MYFFLQWKNISLLAYCYSDHERHNCCISQSWAKPLLAMASTCQSTRSQKSKMTPKLQTCSFREVLSHQESQLLKYLANSNSICYGSIWAYSFPSRISLPLDTQTGTQLCHQSKGIKWGIISIFIIPAPYLIQQFPIKQSRQKTDSVHSTREQLLRQPNFSYHYQLELPIVKGVEPR